MNIQKFISNTMKEAMFLVGLNKKYDPQVSQSNKKIQSCDYQANGIISIAKNIGCSPIFLSHKIVKHIALNKVFDRIEVSGPGFINFFLEKTWIAKQLNKINSSKNFYLNLKEKNKKKIIIDYSAPNIAKEMHIGHLRSTIIGDAIAKILIFLGHNVIKANHIGDWGIQFGMIVAFLKEKQQKNINLSNIENIYIQAKKFFDENEDFAKKSRNYLVKLQSGNKYCLNIWKKIVDITILKNKKIYKLLNVTLKNKDIVGESFYNHMLPNVVADLKRKKIAIEHNGATVVFLDEYHNKNGKPMGVIIKKKDGGYLYSTIDIACVKYRCEALNANRILYFVDSRQSQHLMQILSIAKKANYISDKVSFEHHMFGMILNEHGKPFKTREGYNIKLSSLLKEAIHRATILINKKIPNINKKDLLKIAKCIGIGAIKYFDLSKNRINNYVFNWNSMLNFDGNTAPYIQYTYTRILSIIKKSKILNDNIIFSYTIFIAEQQEKDLAIHLITFKDTLQLIEKNCMPHILCNYLYKLSCLFSSFYETCKVLSTNEQTSFSRLKLCCLTAKTLKVGLNIIGIKTLNKM